MNLHYLNKIIPKRWRLLLRYYLPFFKKPSAFHFRMRKIIDNQKNSPHSFDLTVLLEVLQSIDKYCPEFDFVLNALANTIIEKIIANQEDLFENLMLEKLFAQFDTNETLLNKLLLHLSSVFFSNYIARLTSGFAKSKKSTTYYEKQLNWCAKMANKFSFKEKLQLIRSLPKALISEQIDNINQLITNESQNFINGDFFDLNIDLQEDFLQFFLEQKNNLAINYNFFSLLYRYYNLSPKQFDNFVHKQFSRLPIEEQLFFWKDLFRFKVAPVQTLLTLIFKAYPKYMPQLVDALIFDYLKNPSSDSSSLLIPIQQKLFADWLTLNLFQLLSISTITKKSFAAETLLAAYLENEVSLSDTLAIVSPEIQSLIIEATIATLQTYISGSIIAKIPRKSEKFNLHSRWGMFIKNEYIDPSKPRQQQLHSIIVKIPEDIRKKEHALFSFLLDLYQIHDSPTIRELIEKRRIQADRQAVAYEINQEERRALVKRIALGGQVSHQRMQEVFGKDAQQQENFLSKKFNVSFFNGKDEHEYKNALLETQQMKLFETGIAI